MEPEGSLSIYKIPPLVPILSQINPVHAPSHFLKIRLNIILPFISESSQWSLSPRSHHQNPVTVSSAPRTFIPCISNTFFFDFLDLLFVICEIKLLFRAAWNTGPDDKSVGGLH